MADKAEAAENAAAGNENNETPERTFTQAELDAILAGRLAKFSDYDAIKAELDKVKRESETETEKAIREARAEATSEALKKANARVVTAEARAIAAAEGWLYPNDAPRYLDIDAIAVNDSGEVDEGALKKALADAVKDRPALLKSDKPEVPAPSNAGIGVHAPTGPRTAEQAWADAL